MTTVPPPTTPQPQMPAAPPAATAVLIVSPPPAVAALPAGTVLEAVVVPTPEINKPAVTLRTPQGDVTIKLPVQLPEGAKVALEILRSAQANTPQVSARVVTVNDQPAAQALAQLARASVEARAPLPVAPPTAPINPLLQPTLLQPGVAWMPTGPQPLPALGTFSAFVIQGMPPEQPQAQLQPTTTPQAAPQTPAAPVFSPPTATDLAVRVTGVQLPPNAAPAPLSPSTIALVPPPITTPQAVVATPAAQTPIIVPQTTPLATAQPQQPLPLTSEPQPGLVLPNKNGLPTPTPQPPLTVQPAPALATVTATVTSLSPAGAPIVSFETGTAAIQVQLNVRANLPPGTRVTLEITGQQPPPPLPTTAPLPITSLPLTGLANPGWPTLTESLALLQRIDPVAAQQLAQAVPDGGPRTAAALMSFAQAMRGGDARQWPGDVTLRALERSGPRGAHLASTLSDEVAALSSRAREGGAEWRALPIPWNADGQVERIALITRREGEGDESNKKTAGGGTRFLIELELSRLGSMQLDGMFKKQTRALDLMIRTKAELPDTIRRDLTGIFANSNAAMGLKGGLTFQVVKKFASPLGQANPWAEKPGVWA